MEISFHSKKLRNLCSTKNRAKIQLGEFSALKLTNLLADLDALNNVNELLSLGIHNSEINDSKSFTIELTKDSKVVFSANHLETPLLADKTTDWSKVTRIKILSIERTNDEK